ncbi:multifunctional transcriptional regulator/nicotinamide-nucleotide adenylyltransferase/ribosylnicotinamide kinase NadR [Cardiobacteriaceae bacterium TAE3-ERU3]|nr:multifunctional transcriptional regulator/nicotinamide-nucleotide adenylyltransferase/ribosylnicotinamide kinase NadR [Cardiobacteriaceae bacterium TAE3-ERU3]
MNKPTTGWIIGHFEPLHQGHIKLIQHAVGLVNQLHIVILNHPNPNPDYPVTLQDKARWLQRAFRAFDFVQLHTYDMINIDPSAKDAQAKLKQLREACGISAKARLISDESHPWREHLPPERLILLPRHDRYDTDTIHNDPVNHWHYIHPTARRNYTQTVVVAGGESSGKTTLVHKLANRFLADYVLELGRLYVDYDLGGSELALQYSDYQRIAIDHAKAVNNALEAPKAPVTIIDTDFVTTQAFCEIYEGQTDPTVATFIDQMRFSHTILLNNNTVWVDDGLRSLGSEQQRQTFQNKLKEIYTRHSIKCHEIHDSGYHARYENAVDYIVQNIYNGKS